MLISSAITRQVYHIIDDQVHHKKQVECIINDFVERNTHDQVDRIINDQVDHSINDDLVDRSLIDQVDHIINDLVDRNNHDQVDRIINAAAGAENIRESVVMEKIQYDVASGYNQ